MAAEARWGRRVLWRWSTGYAVGMVLGVVLTMLNDDSTAVNKSIARFGNSIAWWQPWGPRALQRIKWTLFELCGVSCSIAALFTLLFFEQALHRACAAMLREVGRRFQDPKVANLSHTIAVHVLVLRACRQTNAVFGLMLPLYLLVCVALSLLSTVTLVKTGRDADTFALLCFPDLFIFFVPMCAAGQRVQDASQGLAYATYSVCPFSAGPWLEEDPDTRRSRIMVMTTSTRPATFTTPGIGSLNYPSCRKGLRSWFQFVQVLMNLDMH